MTSRFAAVVLVLAACGSASPAPTGPAPTAPAPTAPAPTGDDSCGAADGVPADAAQCECLGYQVVGDIGDGQVACPDGAREVARIRYGIEGGLCCAPAQAAE